MKKRLFAAGIAAIFALFAMQNTVLAEGYQLPDGVGAALVMEASSGSKVFEFEAGAAMDVAGLARLPAVYTICSLMDEGKLKAEEEVAAGEQAKGVGGPSAYVKPGELISAGDLLKAAVMISAGDAILALSGALMGSSEAFCTEVNRRLAQLGVTQQYTDPLGAGVQLCAEDLAKLGAALHKSATFRSCSSLTYEVLEHKDGRKTELASANKLLKSCSGCSGTATGSSQSAGYCGVFCVERSGVCYVCVVLGAKNAAQRAETAGELVEYSFNNFAPQTLAKKGQVFGNVAVLGGGRESIELVAAEDVVVLMSPNAVCMPSVELPEALEAPLSTQSVAGCAEFLFEGNVVARVSLVPREDIPVATVVDYFKMVLLEMLH